MTSSEIRRLVRLTALSYERRWTDAEADEYNRLFNAIDDSVMGVSVRATTSIMNALRPHLNTLGKISMAQLWRDTQGLKPLNYSYETVTRVFNRLIKEMFKQGKANKITSYKWEIIKPYSS